MHLTLQQNKRSSKSSSLRKKTGRRGAPISAPVLSFLLSSALLPAGLVYIGMGVLHSIPTAVLLYHAYCLFRVAVNRTRASRFQWPPLDELIRATLSGVVLSCAGVLLWRLTGDAIADPDLCRIRMVSLGLPIPTWGVFAAYFLLVNPVIEEYYWRGCLQSQARNVGIKNDAMVAIPFSVWHIVPIWLVCGPLAAILGGLAVYGVGIVLTMMYRLTGDIGRCVVWHAMMADVAVISLMFACK